MWKRAASLLPLILASAWFGHAPDWEPALAVAGTIVAVITLDYKDHKRLKKALDGAPSADAPPTHVEHDRGLFRRYESILSEQRLRDELNGGLYNGDTTNAFMDSLDRYRRLHSLAEGRFLIDGVQVMMERFQRDLANLEDFVLRNFFQRLEPSLRNEGRVFLHPDIKYEQNDHWSDLHDQLQDLLDRTEASCVAFRNEVKARLVV